MSSSSNNSSNGLNNTHLVIGIIVGIIGILAFFNIKSYSDMFPNTAINGSANPQLPIIAGSSGKYPCPLTIRSSEVSSWKIGQVSVPDVRSAVRRFDDKRPYDEGHFKRGTIIPSGVLVATNFDEKDGNTWTNYPVIPIIHSGSYGLFQTTGEYTAPNEGACITIIP